MDFFKTILLNFEMPENCVSTSKIVWIIFVTNCDPMSIIAGVLEPHVITLT